MSALGSVSIPSIPERFMLKNIDLTREVPKPEYKRLKAEADLKLAALQRQSKALGIPIIVVFEGWSAAGKGTLINEMILPLDPRGFSVYSTRDPTEEDTFYRFSGDFGSELQPAAGWRSSIGAGTAGWLPTESQG
jgi:polyphosphate kinase 2 (PPK2 family)